MGLGGSWNIVDAALGPGMTTRYPSHHQPRTPDSAVDLKGTETVSGTAGVKFAYFAVAGRHDTSPQLHESHQRILQHVGTLPKALRQALAKSPARRSGSRAAGGNARTTTSAPNGVSWAAAMCRRRRFTRLRCTALPTFLDTTKPTRVDSGGVSPAARATWTTTDGVAALTLDEKTA